MGLDLVNTPELAALPENAARVAAWQWNSRGLNEQAQAGDFATTTKRLSGRLNHQAEREALHGASLAALTNSKGAPNATLAAAPNAGAIDATASTSGMSESQKYDHYRSIIEANGGSVKDAPGQRHVLGLRTEDHKVNAYDDKMAVLWRDQNGSPRVREFASNMESISRYQGRYGNDLNRDGRRDLATLEAGNYEYTRGSSRTFGQVLRPVGTTPVMRDTTGDGHGDRRDARGAGGSILFHAGGRRDTGSAGCQTLPPDQFRQFLGALGSDRRVSYTVVDVE